MKKQWLIALFVAAAGAGVAFAITRWCVCSRPAASLDRLSDVAVLSRELGLSAAQAGGVRQLHVSLGAKLNDCCARHCAARARLAQALNSDTNGAAQAQALVAEMVHAYEESEQATLDNIERVRDLLTPEQRQRFTALLSTCLCDPREMRNCAATGMGGTDACPP